MALTLTYEKKAAEVIPDAAQLKLQQSAARLSALRAQLEEAEAQYSTEKAEFLAMAQERRAQQLKLGLVENLHIPIEDAEPVQVLWSDKARRTLPSINIAELRRAFGADYSACVKETCSISLRSGLTLEAIEKRIGERALQALMPLLNVRTGVCAADGATKRAAAWLAAGDARGEDLLQFVEATHSAPCVRTR